MKEKYRNEKSHPVLVAGGVLALPGQGAACQQAQVQRPASLVRSYVSNRENIGEIDSCKLSVVDSELDWLRRIEPWESDQGRRVCQCCGHQNVATGMQTQAERSGRVCRPSGDHTSRPGCENAERGDGGRAGQQHWVETIKNRAALNPGESVNALVSRLAKCRE